MIFCSWQIRARLFSLLLKSNCLFPGCNLFVFIYLCARNNSIRALKSLGYRIFIQNKKINYSTKFKKKKKNLRDKNAKDYIYMKYQCFTFPTPRKLNFENIL